MRARRHNGGFSLIEVMCAILIMGVALVALTRGMTTALASTKDSEVQTTVVTLAASSPARSLHLARLYGAGLAAAKTDNRIASADDYPTTQQWSKAFHDHPQNFDGIVYMSRYTGNHRSVVLFDRARDAIAFDAPRSLLHHPDLAHLLDAYHVSLVPPGGKGNKKKKKKKKRSARRRKSK